MNFSITEEGGGGRRGGPGQRRDRGGVEDRPGLAPHLVAADANPLHGRLLAGHDAEKSLVGRIRVRGYEMGLEARPFLYPAAFRSLAGSTSERVLHLVQTAREVAAAVRRVLGDRVHETPVIAELLAEDILEIAMIRAGVTAPPVVPYEAASALAMLLLRDYGVITVQLVGVPPGTSAVMLKFIAPETLARFGGADAYARAIDDCLMKLAGMLAEPRQIAPLLLGE